MAVSVTTVLANLFGGRLVARSGEAEAASPSQPAGASIAFRVSTIHCQGCVNTIAARLMAEEGVEAVDGDARRRIIRVGYHPTLIEPCAIEAGISRLGHVAEPA